MIRGAISESDLTPKDSNDLSTCLGKQILSIDHVAIAVADLEQGIEWYTKCLGFQLIERRYTRGNRTAMISAVLVSGGALIVLIQGTSADSQVSRFVQNFGPGVQHLGFSVQDLSVSIDRVTAAGRTLDTPIIANEGIRQVFLRRDPASGVRVELIERRGGDFSDKSVAELFGVFETRGLF